MRTPLGRAREHLGPTERRLGEGHEEPYAGSWWRFPPIRNALISGVLLGVTFLLARIDLLPGWAEIGWYAVVGALDAVCSMKARWSAGPYSSP